MGLFVKRTKPDADLARDGLRCRATVEHADMLGQGSSHFNLSNAKAESILSGEETPLRFKVRLRVEPDDKEHLAIDWHGSHQEGSIADLFADNPPARAALEGAGLDPERIAREADEGRGR